MAAAELGQTDGPAVRRQTLGDGLALLEHRTRVRGQQVRMVGTFRDTVAVSAF